MRVEGTLDSRGALDASPLPYGLATVTDPILTPIEPSRQRSRPRRLVRWAIRAALGFGALALVGLLLLVWHFRATPTFDDYVASHPVSPARFAPPVAATSLGDATGWHVGDVDPFDVGREDALHEAHEFRFEVDLARGDEVLLRVVQVVGLATQRATGARVGFGARTAEFTVRDGLHATACIYIAEPDRVLEDAFRPFSFDVVLCAGAGPSRAEVLCLPQDGTAASTSITGLTPIEDAPTGPFGGTLAKLWPWASLPAEGLVHRLTCRGSMAWRLEGGHAGPSVNGPTHCVNTSEYSYRVKARATAGRVGHPSTEKWIERHVTWSWNDRVW